MKNIKNLKSNIGNSKRYLLNTSVKTKFLYVRRQLLKALYGNMPQQIWIGVTYKCQCKCYHCFLGPQLNKDNNELSREEIFQLIENAKSVGFLEVSFFGGEPLLRNDIADLVKFAGSKGLITSMYTNGILLTRDKISELRQAGLDYCNVSVDSADPERHNALRGFHGGFEKTIEGITNLVDSGIKCSIWTYASKRDIREKNMGDMRELIKMAADLKAWKVVILFPIASGNWFCNSEEVLSLEDREKVRSLHDPPRVYLEFPTEDSSCNAGKGFVYISPKGDVFPCPAVSSSFGNIRQSTIRTAANKIIIDFVRKNSHKCGECVMNTSK